MANTVSGTPSPAPPAAGDSLLAIPLWQSATSLAGLSNGIQSRQAAAYGALAGYQDRPYRRVRLHHFDLPCETCHAPSSARRAAVFEKSPSPQFPGDVNRACTSGGCHIYDPSLNHPVAVAVPALGRLPSYMPQDHIDRIDCLTCHSDPRPMTSIAGAADAGERMIVVPDGDDLCGSCHDDIKVTVPRANETRYERTARWATMSDHAIGMRYAAVAGRRTGQFNYPLIESERIRLFDGKVGCGSCHIK